MKQSLRGPARWSWFGKLSAASALPTLLAIGCGAGAPGAASGGASAGGGAAVVGGVSSGGGGVSSGGVPTTPGGSSTSGGMSSGGVSLGGAAGGGSESGEAGALPIEPKALPLINGVQWADDDGHPIQAHGGGLIRVGVDYFWFGENRNDNGSFKAVSVYRSRDLHHWHLEHDALKSSSAAELSPANVERPKVVYNATTKKYVMWMHWENGAGYGEARAAVASADKVDGDYTYHGSFRPLADSGVKDHDKPGYMSRDCGLFVDDDGKGYFISASNENYDLNLYELSADYLHIERLVAVLFKGGHREAPVLFKRNGIYFLLTSGATGWDPNQARYATSTALGSGWSAMADIGDSTTFHSQPTYVLPVTGPAGTSYLYLGDRWAGAWDGRVKDSSYVWQPLTFSSNTSVSMSWNNTLLIDAAGGMVSAATLPFRLQNKLTGLSAYAAGEDAVVQGVMDDESSEWSLDYDGAGYFRIANEKTGKVLEVRGESTADGAAISQYAQNGGAHQAWLVVDLGKGEYALRNKNSGKWLGGKAGEASDGSSLEQRAEIGADEQRWRLLPISK